MKAFAKRISLILLALLMIVSAIALSACDSGKRDRDSDDDDDEGQLSGTYTDEDGSRTVVFKGNKMTATYNGQTMEFEYEIKDDQIIAVPTEKTLQQLCDEYGISRDELTDKEIDSMTMTESFEQGDGWVKIGSQTLYKEGADIGGGDNSDSGSNSPVSGLTLSGTYEGEYGSFEFNGNHVTASVPGNGEYWYTYTIEDDTIIFVYTEESIDKLANEMGISKDYFTEDFITTVQSFQMEGDTLIIEGYPYTKVN